MTTPHGGCFVSSSRDVARHGPLLGSSRLNREQLLSEADDIERLCRPRDLRTSEIFAPNAFYGNDLVLKQYAGLPPDRPLKAVVPHGIVFDRSYVWESERRALLPAVLAYNDDRAQAYARTTGKLPIRTAVPFAYLPKLLGAVPPGERSGTLFFPGHSSHRATAHADFAGMADALTRLDAKYLPATVCIYWRDHELGRHRPFLERGLRVVSAGHIFDAAFLFRLFHLCQRHRYAASNHVGSSLLYSVLAGCRFFVLPGFGVIYSGVQAHLEQDLSRGGELLGELAAAFGAPADEITARQSSLAAGTCGLDHLLGPAELRAVLAMADRLDRFGVARHSRTRRIHVALPRMYPRAAWGLALAARRLAGRLVGKKRAS